MSTGLRKSHSLQAGGSKRALPQHHLDPSEVEEEIPGSPTPMLQQHDESTDNSNYHSLQQQPKHCYIRRSFDRLPARGLGYPAGASARSSPSPSLKTFESGTHPRNSGKTSSFSNYNTIGSSNAGTIGSNGTTGGGSNSNLHQHHPGARLTLSNSDVDGPYRVKRAQQNQTLLKTFSSPYSSASSPHQQQQQSPGVVSSTHPAWRRARGLETSWRPSTTPDDDDNTTTSGSYIINPEELHGEDNGTYNPDIMV